MTFDVGYKRRKHVISALHVHLVFMTQYHRVVGARSRAVQRPAQVVLVRDQVDEEPPGARVVAHERGDVGCLRVPGRDQLGVRRGGRRAPASGGGVGGVDAAVEGVGAGSDEPAQHVADGQARHGRHGPGHVFAGASREQVTNALPGGEPQLSMVAADVSADNHATNLAIAAAAWPVATRHIIG